jgi:hypothetical protein
VITDQFFINVTVAGMNRMVVKEAKLGFNFELVLTPDSALQLEEKLRQARRRVVSLSRCKSPDIGQSS